MPVPSDEQARAAVAAAAIALSRAGLARRAPVPTAAAHPHGTRPSLWALAGRLEAHRTSPARGRW